MESQTQTHIHGETGTLDDDDQTMNKFYVRERKRSKKDSEKY